LKINPENQANSVNPDSDRNCVFRVKVIHSFVNIHRDTEEIRG